MCAACIRRECPKVLALIAHFAEALLHRNYQDMQKWGLMLREQREAGESVSIQHRYKHSSPLTPSNNAKWKIVCLSHSDTLMWAGSHSSGSVSALQLARSHKHNEWACTLISFPKLTWLITSDRGLGQTTGISAKNLSFSFFFSPTVKPRHALNLLSGALKSQGCKVQK